MSPTAGAGVDTGPGPQPAVVLTGRGAGALGLFLALVSASVVTGSLGLVALLAGVGAALLVAPGIAWWRARQALGPPAVHVRLRTLPAMVAVGEGCELDVMVAGPAGRLPPLAIERPQERWHITHRLPGPPFPGLQRDLTATRGRWWRRLVAPSPPSLLALASRDLASQGGAVASLGSVWTGRRGVLGLPPLRVWTHDPFGLFAVAVAVTAPVTVVVHPQPTPTLAAPQALSAGLSHAAGAVVPAASSAAAGWGEFADLRPYVAGDRLNLIDWPALARFDRLLVRRFDPETGAAVRLVLDDRAGVHRRAAFEHLLGGLVGLVDQAVTEGRPVEVTTLSGGSFPVAPTAEGRASFLAVSATLVPRRAGAPTPAQRAGGGALLTTATGAERLGVGGSGDFHVVVV